MTNKSKKIALITGCSGYLGISIVKSFLNLNYLVYGIDIKKIQIKNKSFIFKKMDITKETTVKKLLLNIFNKHNKIDVLINNASFSPYKNFEYRDYNEFKKTIDINLYAPFIMMKNYFKYYRKKKNKFGNIINIASIYGILSPDFKIYTNKKKINSEVYGASKAGLIQMTKYFANYFAPYNIFVNSISPGGIKNKKTQTKDFIKRYNSIVPLKKMADKNDIIEMIMFLTSKKGNYITGQNFIIDGGLSIK